MAVSMPSTTPCRTMLQVLLHGESRQAPRQCHGRKIRKIRKIDKTKMTTMTTMTKQRVIKSHKESPRAPIRSHLRSPVHVLLFIEVADVWKCLVDMGHIDGDPQLSSREIWPVPPFPLPRKSQGRLSVAECPNSHYCNNSWDKQASLLLVMSLHHLLQVTLEQCIE